jgi:PAS domain S-box-containing protein
MKYEKNSYFSHDVSKDVSLKDTDLLYRQLFYRIFDPLALYKVNYDAKGKATSVVFLDINPAYERVMGVKKQNIIGRSFSEVWGASEKEWHDIVLQVAKTGKSTHYEGLSPATGKYLHALAFSPLERQVAVIFLDLTEWKRSEDALQRSEARLIEYREELRNLAAQLSLTEEATRRKFATDLHDRVGYSLATIMHRLEKLSKEAPSESFKKEIENTMGMLSDVIQDTRAMTFEISSPILYEVGLEAALESLTEQLLRPRNITYDFKQNGIPSHTIDKNISILLYQMTRELLINVIKHSEASHVSVRVYRGQKRVRVVVEDNGKGFKKQNEPHWGKWSGYGLFSIRERLHTIDGSIQIISEPEKGTTISLVAPTHMEIRKGAFA